MVSPYLQRECRTLAEAQASKTSSPQPEPINARLLAAAKSALPFVFRELNNAQDDMPTYTALETAIAEAEAQAKAEQAPASEAPINARLLAMLKDARSRSEGFIGSECECDNTHAANGTTCFLCDYKAVIAKAEAEAQAKPERSRELALRSAICDLLPFAESRAEDLDEQRAAGNEDPEYAGAESAWAAVAQARALVPGNNPLSDAPSYAELLDFLEQHADLHNDVRDETLGRLADDAGALLRRAGREG